MNQIKSFVPQAREKTWAGGDEFKAKPVRKGEKRYLYKDGNLEYEDGFFAGETGRFQGEEIVRIKGKPVWGMVYYGGVPQGKVFEVTNEEIFEFLKEALKEKKSEARFIEGHRKYSKDDWRYVDSTEGGIVDFRGIETVSYKGRVVHETHYSGGVI